MSSFGESRRSDRPISRRPANRGAALGWHISKRRLRRRCESNRPTQITACLEYRSTIRFHRAPIQATPKPYLRLHRVYGHKPTAAPVSLHLEQVFLRHLLHWELHISTATHLAKDPTNRLASPRLAPASTTHSIHLAASTMSATKPVTVVAEDAPAQATHIPIGIGAGT